MLGLLLLAPAVVEERELRVLPAAANREVQAGYQVALLVSGQETPAGIGDLSLEERKRKVGKE